LIKYLPFSSKKYWEKKYRSGGNSGPGSYGRLAEFKAQVINDLVKEMNLQSVIEFGCGDGNQLSYFSFEKYTGFDVSEFILKQTIKKFENDPSKSFFLHDPFCFVDREGVFQADMTMSLDVIFHLVEDEIFNKYMTNLFAYARQFVVIYSSNTTKQYRFQAKHVLHRKFTDWTNANCPDWEMIRKIENIYPLINNEEDESMADFYIFQRRKI
jgi:SAM-dependent methyltransferase